ncbi:peptidylprolyl isomerase [Arsenicicoccus sp. oral taxon 190]|uniref:peptidylprolyl isomerase n=1 Tax=Arsenicicoccus sp. oral taxon 190 TaxID=1658671 RepID=UPI00067A1090|nr:peptidylprolyl isomerase [Arsenicicoccus sp. oral taxon 190]AKT52814.1 peptidylprolyl isomerase [Arsenicicoccus sp. oral taxon 190]
MTREQERARARRRHEKVQAARVAKAQRAARRRQLLAVVATVAIVLALVTGVALAMRGKDDARMPDARSSASAGPPASTGTAAGLHCTPAPAPQATPKTFGTVPDRATAAGKFWVATLETTCGPITVELDGRTAPQTVASFLHLAREGYWAPSPCHRLTASGIYVLQCGDPTGTGSGGPGYGFGIEHAPADGVYPRGTLAMARTQDPQSNGGQFFVVYRDTQLPTQGGGYTIFGKVTAGLDMVDRIAAAGSDDSNGPGDGHPKTAISILKVSVTEKKA